MLARFVLFASLAVAAAALAQTNLHTLSGHSAALTSAAFSPDGKLLLTCAENGEARLWNAETGALMKTLAEKATAAAFYPDGKRYALGAGDGVKIVDSASGAVALNLPGHAGGVVTLVVLADSADAKRANLLATAGSDRAVKLWDAQSGDLRAAMDCRAGRIALAPDGLTLAADSREGVKVFDATTGQAKRELEMNVPPNAIVFSPDARLLAAGGGSVVGGLLQGELRLWDAETGELKRVVKNLTSSLAFTPDGKFLAVGGSGDALGEVKLYETATGNLRNALLGHGSWVTALAFSSDGKRLASASGDKTVKLWDVSDLK